mgnify:CR=1 FL=1
MPAANVTVINKVWAHAGQLEGVVLDYVGPAAYVQVAGAGESISASVIGLKNIFHVGPALSSDALDIIYPIILTNKPVSSVELLWIVLATAVEVATDVDLSAKRARLMVWGN